MKAEASVPEATVGWSAGVIEGFYGPPWTTAERERLLEWMTRFGLRTYLHAPKDDPHHRAVWREPLPAAAVAELSDLIAACRRRDVAFVWAIHPGLDIRYSSGDDLAALVARLEQVVMAGGRDFAILFDDVPGALDPVDERTFGRLAAAQAHVANRVHEWLSGREPSGRLHRGRPGRAGENPPAREAEIESDPSRGGHGRRDGGQVPRGDSREFSLRQRERERHADDPRERRPADDGPGPAEREAALGRRRARADRREQDARIADVAGDGGNLRDHVEHGQGDHHRRRDGAHKPDRHRGRASARVDGGEQPRAGQHAVAGQRKKQAALRRHARQRAGEHRRAHHSQDHRRARVSERRAQERAQRGR